MSKKNFSQVEMINYYNINERNFKWFKFRATDRKLIEDFVQNISKDKYFGVLNTSTSKFEMP